MAGWSWLMDLGFFFNISDPERSLIGCRSLIMNDHHEALRNIATHSRSVSLSLCVGSFYSFAATNELTEGISFPCRYRLRLLSLSSPFWYSLARVLHYFLRYLLQSNNSFLFSSSPSPIICHRLKSLKNSRSNREIAGTMTCRVWVVLWNTSSKALIITCPQRTSALGRNLFLFFFI